MAGFTVQPALPGEQALIEVTGFHTSSEGEPFIRIVEGLWRAVATVVPIPPSAIDPPGSWAERRESDGSCQRAEYLAEDSGAQQ